MNPEAYVFVYHAQDREGRMLAALLDTLNRDNLFSFLAVDRTPSIERMHDFLKHQGLSEI